MRIQILKNSSHISIPADIFQVNIDGINEFSIRYSQSERWACKRLIDKIYCCS